MNGFIVQKCMCQSQLSKLKVSFIVEMFLLSFVRSKITILMSANIFCTLSVCRCPTVCMSGCLSVSPSLCMSVCLSVLGLHIVLCFCLLDWVCSLFCLLYFCLSFCLSVRPSVCMRVCLSVLGLYIVLCVCLLDCVCSSFYLLYFCLSFCLAVCLFDSPCPYSLYVSYLDV